MNRRFSSLALVLVSLLLVGLLAALTGCKSPQPEPPATVISEPPATPPPAEPTPPATPEAKPEAKPAAEAAGKPAKGDKTIVKIVTPKGTITCELFDKATPVTAGNFLLLTEEKYYDGLVFHRIEPGFCAQGGDPTGTGAGGPGFTIPDETRPELKHNVGMLSMAKTAAPDSGGSQFFICLGGPETTGHLDGIHTVFGKVLTGMDVAQKLEVGDKMERVEIVKESPYAEAAKKKAKAARKPE